MKVLIKIIIIIFLTSGTCSCDIQKEASKQKNDIDFTESEKTTTFRKGDTVTYIVPNVIYRDTVITTISREGTILRNYYNEQGQLYKNDCLPAEIAIINERLTTLTDQSKNKESKKDENIGMQLIPWIIGGVVVMFLILVLFLFLYLKSMNKKTDALLQLIQNKM